MLEPVEKIWMDGKFVPWGEANVHVLTHSLHYGLAAFEGVRCYKGKSGSAIFRLQEHVDRLFDSAHISMMVMPYDKKQMTEAIVETVRVNRLDACYIRPLVFIGYGAMGVHPGDNPIRVAIAAWKWDARLRVFLYATPCKCVHDQREDLRLLRELYSCETASEG